MGIEAIIILALLIGAVVLFCTNLFPMDLVALTVLGALALTGILPLEELLSGFAHPATCTVAAMFVLSAGLQRTGVIGWITRNLSRYINGGELVLLIAVILVSGFVSMFVNNTAAVAIFMPIVITLARDRKLSPTRFLIPLSYAAMFGGVCTVIGTSTNIVVSEIARQSEEVSRAIGFFEPAVVGLIFFGFGLLYMTTIGRRLLPARTLAGSTEEEFSLREYLSEIVILPGSHLIDKRLMDPEFQELQLGVLEVQRAGTRIWSPSGRFRIEEGDLLMVRGDLANLAKARESTGIEIRSEVKFRLESSDEIRWTEIMVQPRAKIIGQTIADLAFRSRYGAIVLAVHRHGLPLRQKVEQIRLMGGDVLLVQGDPASLSVLRKDPNFLELRDPGFQPTRANRGLLATTLVAAVVILASLEILPILTAAVSAGVLMVWTRCLKLQEAYDSIDWKVIFLLASLLPLGLAMERTGLAASLSHGIVTWAAPVGGAYGVLIAIYLITLILTSFMSNNASAALLAPIAITTAHSMGVSPFPFLFAVMFSASTAFLTPVGYQTNTMVFSAGEYRYIDFFKVGIGLNLLYVVLSAVLIPWYWPF